MNRILGLADYAGMTVSVLCVLHCLGLPLLLSLLPALGLVEDDEAIHRAMVVAAALPALLALIPGFLAHRRRLVPVLGGFGLACFVAAVFVIGPHFGEEAETVLVIIGGVHLFAAHVKNRTFCRHCTVARDQGSCATPLCTSNPQDHSSER